ncbi:3-keto-5-aminohexanoate cleavage protein [Prosthecomicrobium sp. N25]|uniref:3-keto-5-aminohexanoate cleavage protein n=1 Tax=Prosthecomicrobium sp. N25 TaxID=3129254 RepID=UPI0030772FEA
MSRNVFITCALTGAGDTVGRSPHVPITPKQIAESGLDAAAAGASILHIHVRNPETGQPSRDLALYREVVARIREKNDDVILNLTGGMGGDIVFGDDDPFPTLPGTDFVGPAGRMEHILDLKPEMCSLDCGSLNFDEMVYAAKPSWLRRMARSMRGAGVKPELECFEIGHVRMARQLIEEGLIDAPPLFQLCLGVKWAADASPRTMMALVDMLPVGALWAGFGLGSMQMQMVAQAVLLGGHVRVGLEDNLFLSKGVFATNAQLVERAAAIVTILGATVADPTATRAVLGLEGKR